MHISILDMRSALLVIQPFQYTIIGERVVLISYVASLQQCPPTGTRDNILGRNLCSHSSEQNVLTDQVKSQVGLVHRDVQSLGTSSLNVVSMNIGLYE